MLLDHTKYVNWGFGIKFDPEIPEFEYWELTLKIYGDHDGLTLGICD